MRCSMFFPSHTYFGIGCRDVCVHKPLSGSPCPHSNAPECPETPVLPVTATPMPEEPKSEQRGNEEALEEYKKRILADIEQLKTRVMPAIETTRRVGFRF